MKNMKKTIILLAMFCLCFQTVAVLAATPDFSGEWELDQGKSKLPDTMTIESMTLKVSQTDKELKVESVTKMNPNQMRGGGMGRGAQITVYSLEGKEMLDEITGGRMAGGKETRKAAITADGKLNLNVMRNFKNETGDITMKTNEIWELLDAGKTLKVTRYTESPRGATNTEMYFTNKNPGAIKAQTVQTNQDSMSGASMPSNADNVPKKISGGVLNGKALVLGKPEYPAAARAVKASGTVNVQITIDELGNVSTASAVSGHPLLRQAAEQAARDSHFAPTMLSGVPVSVTGVLVYTFTP